MIAEAAWHLQTNELFSYFVVHGAVGLPPSQPWTSFHLHPSSSASSVLPYQPGKQVQVKGRITDISVPAISVAAEWQRLFGDSVVDLMKIDIEGKELDLAVHEGAFLQERVSRIVVEWHKWCVALPQLDSQFATIGFARRAAYDENDVAGLAIYDNLVTPGRPDAEPAGG